jgi:hypothetical protein
MAQTDQTPQPSHRDRRPDNVHQQDLEPEATLTLAVLGQAQGSTRRVGQRREYLEVGTLEL